MLFDLSAHHERGGKKRSKGELVCGGRLASSTRSVRNGQLLERSVEGACSGGGAFYENTQVQGKNTTQKGGQQSPILSWPKNLKQTKPREVVRKTEKDAARDTGGGDQGPVQTVPDGPSGMGTKKKSEVRNASRPWSLRYKWELGRGRL